MIKNSNIQLTSNIYPVITDDEKIDFKKNKDFVARVWDRKALIKLFKFVFHAQPDKRLLERHEYEIHGLSEWQIRRITESDECSLCPGEKPWGIVIRGKHFNEVCKCNRRECPEFSNCRPEMGT